jgi:O-antigen ligase
LYTSKKAILNTAVLITSSMLIVVIITLFRQQQHGFQFAFINDALHPFFRNHVNYSAMLVCMIPIGIALYRYFQNRSFKYFILIGIIVSLFALGLSYSRGAWLALITGAVAWWLLRKRLLFSAYLIFLAISIGGLFWLKKNDRYLHYAHDYKTTIFHKDFAEHLVSTYKLKDVSTAERFYRWIAGVRMIKDNWLTGYGPNNFYDHYKGYAVPAFKTWVSDNKEHSTVHNYFLLVTIEQGLPAFIFLIILFGAMIYYAQLLYHRIEDPFYRNTALVTGIIITMIITVNFLSDLIETDKIGSLFFLSIAMLVLIDQKFSNPPSHIQCIP